MFKTAELQVIIIAKSIRVGSSKGAKGRGGHSKSKREDGVTSPNSKACLHDQM
jgi:hypothetical protein